MIAVEPIYNENYNCIENLIASIATYWGMEYCLISTEVWGFLYDSHICEKELGARIKTNSKNSFEMFEKYYNVKVEYYNKSMFKEKDMGKFVINCIQCGTPVVLAVDIFCCKWTEFYNIYHARHFCMVIDADEKKDTIYCIDPYYCTKIIELPFSEFLSKCDDCIVLKKTNKKSKKSKWYKLVENAALHYLEGTNGFSVRDDMKRFAYDVKNFYSAENEFISVNGKNFSLLTTQINYIKMARLSFSSFLEELANKFNINELHKLSLEMQEYSHDWYNINNLFIKSSYIKNNNALIQRIYLGIEMLADNESCFALKLLEVVEKYTTFLPSSHNFILCQSDNKKIEHEHKIIQTKVHNHIQDVHCDDKIIQTLLSIWKEILGNDNICSTDNFFTLGGNSLTLVLMHNKCDAIYPGKVEIADIFAYPTITELAHLINTQNRNGVNSQKIEAFNLPTEYFYLEESGESVVIIFENDVVSLLSLLSIKHEIQITSFFLTAFLYLLYEINQEDSISIGYINARKEIIPIYVDFQDVRDIIELLWLIDSTIKTKFDDINIVLPNEATSSGILIFFDENEGRDILYKGKRLNVIMSYSMNKCIVRFDTISFKFKNKEWIQKYPKIIRYIIDNLFL